MPQGENTNYIPFDKPNPADEVISPQSLAKRIERSYRFYDSRQREEFRRFLGPDIIQSIAAGDECNLGHQHHYASTLPVGVEQPGRGTGSTYTVSTPREDGRAQFFQHTDLRGGVALEPDSQREEEDPAAAAAEIKQKKARDTLVFSSFFHLAAAKAKDRSSDTIERKAFVGVLYNICNHSTGVSDVIQKLISGSNTKVTSTKGEELDFTFAQVREISLAASTTLPSLRITQQDTSAPKWWE